MPIFEYACHDCGHAFEALVRASDTPVCPHCGSSGLDKQLSVVGRVGAAGKEPEPALAAGPCGACGHPGGPGACAFDD